MLKIFLRGSALVVAAFLLVSVDTADASRADKRQGRQGARIRQGVKSGELTKGETRKLRRQQGHIRRAEKRMQNDGQMTKREKARLERMQDRASKNIHRKKHNERERNAGAAEPANPADVDPIEGGDSSAPDLPPAEGDLE